MARRAVLFIGVILIAGLFLLAVLKRGRSHHEALQVNRGNAAPSSSSPGSQADGTADLMGVDLRGKPAPGFTLRDVSGEKVSLANYKGLAVIVNFWATYCGPCKLEMPWFEQLQTKYKDQGLVILGIDQDEGMAQRDVANAAKHVGASYPILMPEATVSKEYGGVDPRWSP